MKVPRALTLDEIKKEYPDQYIQALEAAMQEARLNHQSSEAVISAVIDVIGGIVEGLPTQRINFLQRVRELVRHEAANADLRAKLAAAEKAIPNCNELRASKCEVLNKLKEAE